MATNNTDYAKLQVRQVALLIETEATWGRGVIRGISDYATKHALWHLLIDPRDHEHRSALPDGWRGDGVIARIDNQLQYERLAKTGLPIVNVDDGFVDMPGVAMVMTDESARAEMALEHFITRGFTSFGYFAPPSIRYSNRRREAFRQAVAEAGYTSHEYRPGYRAGRKIGWGEQQRRVNRWLVSLPRPVAILAVDAYHARQLAEICHFSGIRVPDEVAILAGEPDDLLCEVSTPPLSAISVAAERLGFEAAALLDRMLDGEPCPRKPLLVEPHVVVSRQSTDVLSIDDPMVVLALRYIQSHAHHGISVEDVLREVPMSRRSLELQFRSFLERSPAEEIRRVRLERGRELLGRREMSITEVALSCGFANATRFGVAFRRRFGTTPRNYRRSLYQD